MKNGGKKSTYYKIEKNHKQYSMNLHSVIIKMHIDACYNKEENTSCINKILILR